MGSSLWMASGQNTGLCKCNYYQVSRDPEAAPETLKLVTKN
jgi:hypothetical protein